MKNKILQISLSFLLILTALTGNTTIHASEIFVKEYPVKEDAFIRNGNRQNTNYNFENITKAHGSAYENKGYRVINAKYNGTDEIISVMKFDLPSLEDINDNTMDSFNLEFDIFKNLNFNVAHQGYVFHYTTDSNWDETTLTWNNKPESISKEDSNILFTFYIEKDDEYEFKNPENKHISRDITPTIRELVLNGETEITVFITAKYSANTGLMIHSKESETAQTNIKISGLNRGINLQKLQTLQDQLLNLPKDLYTKESYDSVRNSLLEAERLIQLENATDIEIQNVYHFMNTAYESLEIKYVNVYNDMEEYLYVNDNGDQMPYRLFVPENYSPDKQYPVIVFLHGAGERGNDNSAQLKNAIQTLFDTQENAKEAIIIAPQCPSGKRWVETDWTKGVYDSDLIEEVQLKYVMEILDTVQNDYQTDNDRIYAFGLSMGSYGTWNLLMNHSDVFAGAIAICGSADINKANILKDIPIWAFHGTADNVVPYSGTEDMYNAIIAQGGEKMIFTTYENANHIIWNQATSEDGLIDWLFSQKLSDRLVDKSLLSSLIEEIDNLNENDYTPNSWNQLSLAYSKAVLLFNDDTVNQEDVESVILELQTFKDSLVFRTDTTLLKQTIEDLNGLSKEDIRLIVGLISNKY